MKGKETERERERNRRANGRRTMKEREGKRWKIKGNRRRKGEKREIGRER